MSSTEEHEFLCKVDEHGSLPEYTKKAIGVILRNYAGQVIKVRLKHHTARRSVKQQGYYWSVIVPGWKAIFREGGTILTNEEVHAYLVYHVAGYSQPILHPNGEPVMMAGDVPAMEPMSTSKMTTKQYSELLDICRAEALIRHKRDIPPPDKFWNEDYEEKPKKKKGEKRA